MRLQYFAVLAVVVCIFGVFTTYYVTVTNASNAKLQELLEVQTLSLRRIAELETAVDRTLSVSEELSNRLVAARHISLGPFKTQERPGTDHRAPTPAMPSPPASPIMEKGLVNPKANSKMTTADVLHDVLRNLAQVRIPAIQNATPRGCQLPEVRPTTPRFLFPTCIRQVPFPAEN